MTTVPTLHTVAGYDSALPGTFVLATSDQVSKVFTVHKGFHFYLSSSIPSCWDRLGGVAGLGGLPSKGSGERNRGLRLRVGPNAKLLTRH